MTDKSAALAAALAEPLQRAAAALEQIRAAAAEAAAPPPPAVPEESPVAVAMRAQGFEVWNMGGNSEVWGIKRPDGKTYLSICAKDDSLPDTFDSDVLAGVYGNDGSDFICREDMGVMDSIKWGMQSRAPFDGEQTYFNDGNRQTGLPMPVVGACYLIRDDIERFPFGIAKAGQLATVTAVDAHNIWLRPATPLDFYDSEEPAHWGAVAFHIDGTGWLAEFHDCCVLQQGPSAPAAPALLLAALEAIENRGWLDDSEGDSGEDREHKAIARAAIASAKGA